MDTNYGAQLNEAVAAQIRAERAANGMTIAQLVEASGISKSQLLRLVHAKCDIDMRDLALISSALSVEPAEVMRRAQDRMTQRKAS